MLTPVEVRRIRLVNGSIAWAKVLLGGDNPPKLGEALEADGGLYLHLADVVAVIRGFADQIAASPSSTITEEQLYRLADYFAALEL